MTTLKEAIIQVQSAADTPTQPRRLEALWSLQHALAQAKAADALADVFYPHAEALLAALTALVPHATQNPALRALLAANLAFVLPYAADRPRAARAVLALVAKAAPRDGHRAAALRLLAALGPALPLDDPVLSDTLAVTKKSLREKNPALVAVAIESALAFASLWPKSAPAFLALVAKNIKAHAADKAVAVRLATASFLTKYNQKFPDAASFDLRLSTALKLLSDPESSVRLAAAQSIAALFLNDPDKAAAAKTDSASRPLADGAAERSDSLRRTPAKNPFTAILKKTLPQLESMLLKSGNASPAFRAAFVSVFTTLIDELGGKDIDANMDYVVLSILHVLQNVPQKKDDGQIRECIIAVLSRFGSRLREVQQHRMAQILLNVLCEKINVGKTKKEESDLDVVFGENEAVTDSTLIAAMRVLCTLIPEIGEAGPDFRENVVPVMCSLMHHDLNSVRFSAVASLRALGRALPEYLSTLLRVCIENLSQNFSELFKCKDKKKLPELCRNVAGFGCGAAALISEIDPAPWDVPSNLMKMAFVTAQWMLLADKELPMYNTIMDTAWSIIGALFACESAEEVISSEISDFTNTFVAHLTTTDVNKKPTEAELDAFIGYRISVLNALAAFFGIQKRHSPGSLKRNSSVETLTKSKSDLPVIAFSVFENPLKTFTASIAPLTTHVLGEGSKVSQPMKSKFALLISSLLKTFFVAPKNCCSCAFAPLAQVCVFFIKHGKACPNLPLMLKQEDDILNDFDKSSNDLESAIDMLPGSVTEEDILCEDSDVIDMSLLWNSSLQNVLSPTRSFELLCSSLAVDTFARILCIESDDRKKQIMQAMQPFIAPTATPASRHNTLAVVFRALRIFSEKNSESECTSFPGYLKSSILAVLNASMASNNTYHQRAVAEGIAILCRVSGDKYTAEMFQKIVALMKMKGCPERNICTCALVLGNIQRYVGGISASKYLGETVKIMHELCYDQSPLIQVCALFALSLTVDAAGPALQPLPTISLIIKLLHSPLHASQLTLRAIGFTVNSIVAALGPGLDPGSVAMRVGRIINEQLRTHPNPLIQQESIRFYQRLIMFAAQTVSTSEVVSLVRSRLTSPWISVRKEALTCLRMLVQGQWGDSTLDKPELLINTLFDMLDNESDEKLLKEGRLVLSTLFETLAPTNPRGYLDILSDIILTTHSSSRNAPVVQPQQAPEETAPGEGAGDEEAADEDETQDQDDAPAGDSNVDAKAAAIADLQSDTFGDRSSRPKGASMMSAEELESLSGPQNELVPRWRTKMCALDIARLMLANIHSLSKKDYGYHFDPALGKKEGALCDALDDMIKIVFFASTTPIVPLRAAGIGLLHDVVRFFGQINDTVSVGHRVLELQEVQIITALTTAFAADSPPTATAYACHAIQAVIENHVCASQSIPRLLSFITEKISTLRSLSFDEYSGKASTIVQVAVLSSLARLMYPSPHIQMTLANNPEYSEAVKRGTERHKEALESLWIDFLMDYGAMLDAKKRYSSRYSPVFSDDLQSRDTTELFEKSWGSLEYALACIFATDMEKYSKEAVVLLSIITHELSSAKLTDRYETQRLTMTVETLAHLMTPKLFEICTSDNLVQELVELVSRVSIITSKMSCSWTCVAFETEESTKCVNSHIAICTFTKNLCASIPESTVETLPHALVMTILEMASAQFICNTLREKDDVRPHAEVDCMLAVGLCKVSCEAYIAFTRLLRGENKSMVTDVVVGMCLQWLRYADILRKLGFPMQICNSVGTIVADNLAALVMMDKALLQTASSMLLKCGDPATDPVLFVVFVRLLSLHAHPSILLPFDEETLAVLQKCVVAMPIRLQALAVVRTIIQAAATVPEAKDISMTLFAHTMETICRVMAKEAVLLKDPKCDKSVADAVKEEVSILMLGHTLADDQMKKAILAVALASLYPFLDCAAAPTSNAGQIHALAYNIIMREASTYPDDFRMFVACLPPDEKAAFEGAMRATAEAAQRQAAAAQAAQAKKRPMAIDMSKFK